MNKYYFLESIYKIIHKDCRNNFAQIAIRSIVILLLSFCHLSLLPLFQNGIYAKMIYSEYYKDALSGEEDRISTLKVCLDNIFEIEPMSMTNFEAVMKDLTYRKEFFSKIDKNAYRFVIGNENRIKGIHTVQRYPQGIFYTWKSYGNKTRTLDDLLMELKKYRIGEQSGGVSYKFNRNGKLYTFIIRSEPDFESCNVHIQPTK
ncbi:hypothetical protein [Larkinella rosea]|uniref:Uncharacterized protein n=1 Tax=Larkinella rosea TaxID=2025312 RepID=A0A3P1C0H0_9BACT|nr:hypothetical protein [Larkinella rosea]RRB06837.1 hypothetical protein EHT25_03340 [Larkinella rosea]